MENNNADNKYPIMDKRLLNCQIKISSENVLIDRQVIYSLLESIVSLEKAQKKEMLNAS